MPPATQPSASAPVRAAGLVLTLVATAAGAAGATTLSPDAPPTRPSAHDVATTESDAPAPAAATVSRVTYASPGPSFDPLLAEGRAQHERNARVAREAAAEQAAAAAEQAAAAQAAAEILAAQAEEDARRVAMWDALANCETGGDWQNGGEYGGGLGIYVGTWKMYGGHEFATRPQHASKEHQIVVAERIARDGMGGWGCAHTLGWTN